MSKSIILTPSQIKALQSGATMFLLQISDYDLNRIDKGYSIGDSFPINKGDKNISIIPKKCSCNIGISNKTGKCISCGTFIDYPMTSYNYSFSECIAVRIVRADDITLAQMEFILGKRVMVGDATPYMIEYFYETYNQQMKEQNINRTYEDNDYVFLIEFA